MSALADIAATDQQPAPATEAPKHDGATSAVMPDKLYVIDTTAIAKNSTVPGKGGARTHEMRVDGILRSFTFEPGVPLEMTFPVAIKFLKIEGFKRTDKDGNLMPYQRQPKQPHELGAGEKFELRDDETIAKISELANMHLLQRALELPGGEMLKDRSRAALIEFIIRTQVAQRQANMEKTAATMRRQGQQQQAQRRPVTDDDGELSDIPAFEDEE